MKPPRLPLIEGLSGRIAAADAADRLREFAGRLEAWGRKPMRVTVSIRPWVGPGKGKGRSTR